MQPISQHEQLVLQLLDVAEAASRRARAAAALAFCDIDRFMMCTAVPALRIVSEDEADVVVRAAALKALGKIVGEFNDSPAIRRHVMKSFGTSPSFNAEDMPLILNSLVDSDGPVRKATVTLLKNAFAHTPSTVVPGMEEVIERLAESLCDADVEVRREAADAFNHIRWDLIRDQRRLENDPTLLRHLYYLVWAIDAFHRFAVPFLTMSVKDSDSYVQRAASDVLLTLPNDQARHDLVSDLVRMATDTDVSVRYDAIIALGRVLDRCDGEERKRIVFALLERGSRETSDDVRLEVARALREARRLL